MRQLLSGCCLLAGLVISPDPVLSEEPQPSAQTSAGSSLADGPAKSSDEIEVYRPLANESDEKRPIASVPETSAKLPGDIEEIIVTSRSGSQSIQDIGISVAAFNTEYLAALGAQNIADIAQFTPNVEIRTVFAASNPTLFIRGVGLRDFNANSSSSVAVYNDDVYMNSPAGQLGQFFDLQQVEVLRGPQGALYGRNASAGAIRVLSRKPVGDPNGYARLTYGNYDDVEAEGALEVPINPSLAVRFSGRMRVRDGTTLNRCGDPRWKDASDSPDLLNFDVMVHGIRDRINPRPYGTSRGCFNTHTMAPLISEPSGIYQGRTGLGWVPGTRLNPAPAPPPVSNYVNDVDNWAVRGLLRWRPNDRSDWMLNIHGGKSRGGTRQFQGIGARYRGPNEFPSYTIPQDIRGYADRDNAFRVTNAQGRPGGLSYYDNPFDGDPFAGSYNRTEPEKVDLYGASLTGEIMLRDDSLLFKTISGFEGNQRHLGIDMDASPFISVEPTLSNESWQLSQEFKLIWDSDGPLSGEAGASYLYEDLHVLNRYDLDPLQSATDQDYTLYTHYGAVYGWLSWSPVELFSIDGGLRWNYEHKEFDLTTNVYRLFTEPGVDIPLRTANPPPTSVSDTGPSGDLTFNFKPTEEFLAYLKYSRGYKGPHINGLILNPRVTSEAGEPLSTPVKPEKVDALELGIKSSWLDDTLTLNGAVFYYDYKDMQIFQLRNSRNSAPIEQLINADDARIYGAEIEIRSQPLVGRAPSSIEGLEVLLSFGWLHGTYNRFTSGIEGVNDDGVVEPEGIEYSGNRMVNAPEFAFSGYASWPLRSKYGTLIPRFDWTFKDQVFLSPENDPRIGQAPLWLFNFRLGYRTPDSKFEISGWVRNLTNEAYALEVINLARLRYSVVYAIGDPRTYGITVGARF